MLSAKARITSCTLPGLTLLWPRFSLREESGKITCKDSLDFHLYNIKLKWEFSQPCSWWLSPQLCWRCAVERWRRCAGVEHLELLMLVRHVDPSQGLFDHPHHQVLLWRGRGGASCQCRSTITMTRFIQLYFNLINKYWKLLMQEWADNNWAWSSLFNTHLVRFSVLKMKYEPSSLK